MSDPDAKVGLMGEEYGRYTYGCKGLVGFLLLILQMFPVFLHLDILAINFSQLFQDLARLLVDLFVLFDPDIMLILQGLNLFLQSFVLFMVFLELCSKVSLSIVK